MLNAPEVATLNLKQTPSVALKIGPIELVE